MKRTLLALALAGLGTVAQASTVVTFDDLDDYELYPGYGGVVDWSSAGLHWSPDYAVSGEYFAHGGTIDIGFVAPIVFEGTYYNSWGGAFDHSYSLYYQGNLVYEGIPTTGEGDGYLYWIGSGYSGLVDRAVFYGSSDGAVIDNLTYTMAPVPEPGSYAMLLLGLGVTGALARRQKRLASR